MGAFFLLRGSDATEVGRWRDTLAAEFAVQGFGAPRRFAVRGCEIHLYPKLGAAAANAHVGGPGEFCLSAGTVVYRGASGAAALQRLHADFAVVRVPWDDLCGQFCLIVAQRGRVHLLTDRLGLFKVYRNADGSVLSSSFLAAAAACERLTINPQAVYEYISHGASFGLKTAFHEVGLLDPDAMQRIDADGAASISLAPIARGLSTASFEDSLDANLRCLRSYFAVAATAGDGRISTALSGGYDTRLMLALLRERGVQPQLYVYGTDRDCDVHVARRIAAGEGLTLAHTERGAGPPLERDQFAAVVESNYRFFDGYPVDGIFDDGSDQRTRRQRCQNGELALNGIGGELFRRPDMANRSYPLRDVVWRFYCGFDPAVLTAAFCEADYCAAIAREIQRALQSDADVLTRAEISLLIPAFYYRYWAGRNNSINNRVGRALQPFCDLPIVRESIRIPVAHRCYGRFESALIRAVDPRLAAYASCHGHDFMHPPPLRNIVREWLAAVRPAVHYRYTQPPAREERPYWLADSYLGGVIDLSFPYLRRFVHVERVATARRYNRICTLEHLFQRCAAQAA